MISESTNDGGRIPVPLKLGFAAATLVWTLIHLRAYPPATMLWFCAYGNVAVAIALLLESRLLLSMQSVALLIPQTVWTIDAAWRLLSGARGGGTSYVFEPAVPLPVRLLSLYHLAVPALLLYTISRLGYDARALRLQCAIGTAVLLASTLAGPLNVNGVHAPLAGTDAIPPAMHLVAALVVWPMLAWLPAHLLLLRAEKQQADSVPRRRS